MTFVIKMLHKNPNSILNEHLSPKNMIIVPLIHPCRYNKLLSIKTSTLFHDKIYLICSWKIWTINLLLKAASRKKLSNTKTPLTEQDQKIKSTLHNLIISSVLEEQNNIKIPKFNKSQEKVSSSITMVILHLVTINLNLANLDYLLNKRNIISADRNSVCPIM